jgi:hypothetical protein
MHNYTNKYILFGKSELYHALYTLYLINYTILQCMLYTYNIYIVITLTTFTNAVYLRMLLLLTTYVKYTEVAKYIIIYRYERYPIFLHNF